nr:uncharacterized protein LOC120974896 [Aegilops tauschii subsp. strangulata]
MDRVADLNTNMIDSLPMATFSLQEDQHVGVADGEVDPFTSSVSLLPVVVAGAQEDYQPYTGALPRAGSTITGGQVGPLPSRILGKLQEVQEGPPGFAATGALVAANVGGARQGTGRPMVDASGAETIWGHWKRYHREEMKERVKVQYAGVKHAKFGVVTPPNSMSDLSSRKVAFATILQSAARSKRRFAEDQEFFINMNNNSFESLEFRGSDDVSVSCKRVCVLRLI